MRAMLRTAWLSAQNDVRLLVKDPVVLLMLLLAPVVIITVAGYSLGAIYGDAGHARVLPVVDHDGGDVAARVVDALRAEPSLRVEAFDDVEAARRLVGRADGPALAVEIPSGTSAALAAGESPRLVLYVDPAKRIEANAIELRLAELSRRAADEARARAQARLDEVEADLRREVAAVTQSVSTERDRIRAAIDAAGARAADAARTQLATAVADAGRRVEAQVRSRGERAWADVESQLADRRARLDGLRTRLAEARASEAAFRDWLARLQTLAGSHASDLPPPPAFPVLPSDAELAELARPLARPPVDRGAIAAPALSPPSITIASIDPPSLPSGLDDLRERRFERLPGGLGFTEEAASPGAEITVNAFDQYVPGFGVTFLLIGMMLGIALTLFDERSWGTLQRLEASGVPLVGLLLGKLVTRFAVGVVQMVVLFAVGWLLFGISLGRNPAALLLPTVGIAFASAALGLIVPTLASSHDAVMPLGTMLSMAVSAIGGCWWPLGFEPHWMRVIAHGLPTTWAMQAYNDLMIRRMPWDAALWPLAVTLGLGTLYLAAGVAGNLRRRG
jgi:ABC-type multidrug transport system permease subunit